MALLKQGIDTAKQQYGPKYNPEESIIYQDSHGDKLAVAIKNYPYKIKIVESRNDLRIGKEAKSIVTKSNSRPVNIRSESNEKENDIEKIKKIDNYTIKHFSFDGRTNGLESPR